jgi:hypothetical protein
MAYAVPLYRHKMTFLLGSDGEIAVFNIHTRYAGGEDTNLVTIALGNHVASKWNTPFSPLKPMWGPDVALQRCDTYLLDAAGHAVHKSTDVFDGVQHPAWVGTDPAASLPWECSLVVSLDGNTAGYDPHAARKRGRFYLPPNAAEVLAADGTGFFATAKVDLIQAAAQAWLEAINDVPATLGSQARVVIPSKVGGFNSDVVTVRCDNKVDAQRRRENRQAGMYVKSGVLTP